MLPLTRPHRQALATLAMVACTVVPTVYVGFTAWRINRPGHIRDVEIEIGRSIGLQVTVESVRYPKSLNLTRGTLMGTVAHYLEVNAAAETCYAWWRGLTNLPQILPDVESVEPTGDVSVTHWKVSGPLGKSVEWDAKIVEDIAGQKIAWASVDSGPTNVKNSGAVRFDDHGATTGVEVSLAYDPPAGVLGDVVAKLFADPQDKVEKALDAFKATIEKTTTGAA